MHRLLKFMAVLLAATVFFAAEATGEEKQADPIRIGLIYFSPPLSADMDFTPTLRHLREVFKPRKVEAKIYSSSDLEKAVVDGDIDFFFASSGFYWRMIKYGVRDLATIIIKSKRNPDLGTAGIFLTLKENSHIRTLGDMKGHVLLANYSTGFHGFRTGMAELERQGFNHEKFFSEVKFVSRSSDNADKIIEELLTGGGDIAYLRACWLEEFEIRNISLMDKLRVIGARPGSIACLHSTTEYPNNTLGATAKISNELARQMAVALLTMPLDEYGQAWSVATNFKKVDDLYKSLRVGPYEYLRHWTLRRFLDEYWPFLMLAVFTFFGLIIHGVRTEKLVKKKTLELRQEAYRRKKFEDKAREVGEKMEAQHKLNLVGQLSSMFAHEMNQPLGACSYYLQGMSILLKKSKLNVAMLEKSVTAMTKELQRASDIVKRVRAYAKNKPQRTAPVELVPLIEEIVTTMKVKYEDRISFALELKDATVVGEPLEIQVLVWNLVKNAAEAASESLEKTVSVGLGASDDMAELVIDNSVKGMTGEQLNAMHGSVFSSTKTDGLGIGLSVVESIVESSSGQMNMELVDGCRVCVRVRLPLYGAE